MRDMMACSARRISTEGGGVRQDRYSCSLYLVIPCILLSQVVISPTTCTRIGLATPLFNTQHVGLDRQDVYRNRTWYTELPSSQNPSYPSPPKCAACLPPPPPPSSQTSAAESRRNSPAPTTSCGGLRSRHSCGAPASITTSTARRPSRPKPTSPKMPLGKKPRGRILSIRSG